MAKLKGLDKFNQAIKFVKEVAEQTQKELDAKREKNDGNSDKWQESEKAEEWRNHLQEVEDMIARIDDLDEIEFE
jgi:DnaJ-domain-containing protein 1